MKSTEQIVDEVHSLMLKTWTSEELQDFFLGPWKGDSLVRYHHSIGRYIRNTYNLWHVTDDSHPDDYSMKLIELIWKRGYNGHH